VDVTTLYIPWGVDLIILGFICSLKHWWIKSDFDYGSQKLL